MLSARYGVQARGGCACAGPYAHRLLNINGEESELIRADILAGDERLKPGWTRLNLSVLMDDDKADYVIDAVDALARENDRQPMDTPSAVPDAVSCSRAG